MIKLLITFVFLYSQAIFALESCCICVEDPMDPELTQKECKLWLKEQKNCQKKESLKSYMDLSLKDNYTCNKLSIYGAFHGTSIMSNKPFDISQELAEKVSAKEVIYDGSTCLVFNNLDRIKNLGEYLSADTNTKYSISGNQNMGVVNVTSIFKKYKEIDNASSKVTVIVEKGESRISFDKCSKKNQRCGFARVGEDSFTIGFDSNVKTCEDNGKLVEQICCVESMDDAFGTWSKPGGAC